MFLQRLLSRTIDQPRLILTLLALATATVSIRARAQEVWQIDPKQSVAILALGSGFNTLPIGLARVSGEVIFESRDPADPIVRFKITSRTPRTVEYASMSFSSKRSVITADGKLAVMGELSVTRVERSVTMKPNEAYAGPLYGDPVANTITRQVTLVFSGPHQRASRNGAMHFSGTNTISREDFSQLLDAITMDDWPSQLVNDEKCKNPSTIGEDYHGSECTGTVIASVSNVVVSTEAPSGEGFHGFEPLVSLDHNVAKIGLDLKLNRMSAGMAPKLPKHNLKNAY